MSYGRLVVGPWETRLKPKLVDFKLKDRHIVHFLDRCRQWNARRPIFMIKQY